MAKRTPVCVLWRMALVPRAVEMSPLKSDSLTVETASLPSEPASARSVSSEEPVLEEPALPSEEPVPEAPPPELTSLTAVDAEGHLLRRCVSPTAFAKISDEPPVRAVLGRGSWGHVWRAQESPSGRALAVKNGPRELILGERASLEKAETQPHAFVVRLLHSHAPPDLQRGSLFLELCPHGDVGERIQAHSRRERYECPALAGAWLAQTFLALEHLHFHVELLHLDVKPGNLLLGASEEVKLADFGASVCGLEGKGWPHGVPPGSPGFVAPEVLRQESFGPKVDLYSFGALIWALLSGGQPPTRLGMVDGGRFGVLCNDYQLLTHEVRSREQGLAAGRNGADARELLLGLISCNAHDRYSHNDVRGDVVAQGWDLPAFGAPRAELQCWCRRFVAQN